MKVLFKSTILFLLFSLFLSNSVLSTDVEYAFITTYDNIESIEDDDEKAAATWFSLFNSNGDIITTSGIKNNEVDLSQYKVIWLHIDKENGTGAIPSILKDPNVKTKLTDYYKQGGNLLLTTHATQYIADLGRTLRYPTIIGAGVANFNADVWTVNPNIGLVNNYLSHPIYAGLSTNNTIFGHTTIPLIGSGMKEDHNSMWDLNSYGYSGNVVNDFEVENNARVIGTWGQVTDFCCGGIIEFLPTSEYKGSCLAIGVAAYEWSQNDRVNEYLSNIHLLTTNSLTYLASDKPAPDTTEIESGLVAHFPMVLNESKTSVTEIISNRSFVVENAKDIRENILGAEGNALRFDGFSTFIKGRFNVAGLSDQAISTSVWCALESYPMMNIDGASDAYTVIAGNISNESGFAFVINAHGRYGFEMFINGTKVRCDAPDKLPRYEWVNLAAVVSVGKGNIQLFKNNELIAKTNITTTLLNTGSSSIYIGKSYEDLWSGPFRLNTINGLIDDFRIYSGEQNFLQNKQTPENPADLSIPKIRFENEIQRPVFHAMPAANWANEPHGMIYHNGKYHLFFQKNANGPYWGRIHWGHVTSEDLITWKEEKVAIFPEAWYDFKGAWSGCVFSDPELTNGLPYIYYTSVDLGKASIAEARPLDNNLINWAKNTANPVIPNRPSGLDDDFRDPYIFKSNNTIYMVVGSKKGGKGTVTLHQYNKNNKTWSNDGRVFYQASSADYGTFWEMPVIVPMNDGKWLFAVTPLGAKNGVETLYWVGSINQDGTFNPYSHTPKEVDLGNMSKDGFGLLSPSVMQHDGKTVVVGIVPDKLSGEDNRKLGWAHTFSLPREWSLDANNNLVQKPFDGLRNMRTDASSFSIINQNLSGVQSMEPVNGKAIEIEGIFTVSSHQDQKFGFNVRKNGLNAVKIFYEPARNLFTVDARSINRLSNDNGSYNGLYVSSLPESIAVGQTCKIHLFIDHSIMDVFINNQLAFSIRIFPTDLDSNGVEVFAEGTTTYVNSVKAWKLSEGLTTSLLKNTNQDNFKIYFSNNELIYENLPENATINIYDSMGRLLANNIHPSSYSGANLDDNKIYLFRINSNNSYSIKKITKIISK